MELEFVFAELTPGGLSRTHWAPDTKHAPRLLPKSLLAHKSFKFILLSSIMKNFKKGASRLQQTSCKLLLLFFIKSRPAPRALEALSTRQHGGTRNAKCLASCLMRLLAQT